MTFVRWHYRDGAYVRSHYRRCRRTPSAAQMSFVAVGIPGVAHGAITPDRSRERSSTSGRSRPRRSGEHIVDATIDMLV